MNKNNNAHNVCQWQNQSCGETGVAATE